MLLERQILFTDKTIFAPCSGLVNESLKINVIL